MSWRRVRLARRIPASRPDHRDHRDSDDVERAHRQVCPLSLWSALRTLERMKADRPTQPRCELEATAGIGKRALFARGERQRSRLQARDGTRRCRRWRLPEARGAEPRRLDRQDRAETSSPLGSCRAALPCRLRVFGTRSEWRCARCLDPFAFPAIDEKAGRVRRHWDRRWRGVGFCAITRNECIAGGFKMVRGCLPLS